MDLARLGETARGATMRLFSPLYRRAMVWSRHPHAPWYLGSMSFAESSFFPIPPDVMLAPMCLANPRHAWRLALLTTLTSVAGGLFGYAIGYFAIDALLPWLQDSRYWPAYQTAVEWFGQWGFWAVFIAGFSPIPYKVFTIAAGALSMALLPFTIASLIGRGARFFLVAGLMAWGGARMEAALHSYVDRLGWATVALLALGLLAYR
jgi:membrane protein YqaA with SNARE-associated domain